MTTKELKALILFNWIDTATENEQVKKNLREQALRHCEESEDEIKGYLQEPVRLQTWQEDH